MGRVALITPCHCCCTSVFSCGPFLSFFFRYQSPLFSLAMPPTATYLLCLYCDGAGRKDRYWNFMTKEIIQRKRKKKKTRKKGKGECSVLLLSHSGRGTGG